jgi:hypothetical protein
LDHQQPARPKGWHEMTPFELANVKKFAEHKLQFAEYQDGLGAPERHRKEATATIRAVEDEIARRVGVAIEKARKGTRK